MNSINQSDVKLPPGTNFCKCGSCGSYFGGVGAFDLHRYGNSKDRACLPPSEVSDGQNRPLLRLNDRGYWVRDYQVRAVA